MSTLILSALTNSNDENMVNISSDQDIEEGALFVNPLPNESNKIFGNSVSF